VNPSATRILGSTGVALTQLGFGGGPIGEPFVQVPDEDAERTLGAAWDAGVRYFDTSPYYGKGLSEHRVGRFARLLPRRELVLSTKIGRLLRAPADPDAFDRGSYAGGLEFEHRFDYGYDAVLRSYEDSLQRLGLNRIDLLLVHDLDSWHHPPEALAAHLAQLLTSGWRALEELRTAGMIAGIGAGINELGMIPRFLDLFDIDFFLVAGRYTLLDQVTLEEELPRCRERGVGIVIGGVFNSGILATGPVPGATYDYAEAPPEIVARVARIEEICRRHHVPLGAAALQFPLGHDAVASVIPGAFLSDHVRANVAHFSLPVPGDLWAELKAEGLLREDAPVPD
jgi:D-threo-aldose 1-dehydrogenase